MADVEFDTSGWLPLSKALKEAGETGLRKELHQGLQDGGRVLVPTLREGLRDGYPKGGGLADVVAKAKARVVARTGRDPGVQIVFKGITIKLGEVYGTFRHPVHGRPTKTRKEWSWVAQPFAPGRDLLYTLTRRNVRLVTPALRDALQRTVDKVVNSRG